MGDDNAIKELRNVSGYIPDSGLLAAADVAIKLEMPLLLTGEPGTGKTLFAKYLCEQHGQLDLHKFVCHTDSAYVDAFYKYDAIGHFRDSQKTDKSLDLKEIEKNYIHYNALGKAISSPSRSIVLIDEIDKAPRDFPNDLLEAIDEYRFNIPELNNKNYEYSGDQNPIIIITSNSEKDLPSAFLRRTVFYHIPFPDEELLIKIVNKRVFEKNPISDPVIIENIAKKFLEIRKIEGLHKKPATAEFLAWVTFLRGENFDFSKLSNPNIDTLRASYSILGKSESDIKKILLMK